MPHVTIVISAAGSPYQESQGRLRSKAITRFDVENNTEPNEPMSSAEQAEAPPPSPSQQLKATALRG